MGKREIFRKILQKGKANGEFYTQGDPPGPLSEQGGKAN